jgi:hypothetical protein
MVFGGNLQDTMDNSLFQNSDVSEIVFSESDFVSDDITCNTECISVEEIKVKESVQSNFPVQEKIESALPAKPEEKVEYAASNADGTLYGIYTSIIHFVSNRAHKEEQINAVIQNGKNDDVECLIKEGCKFCASVGIEESQEVRSLIISFMNYCEELNSASSRSDIKKMEAAQLLQANAFIDAIVNKPIPVQQKPQIHKTPQVPQTPQKDTLAQVWKAVHKRMVKLVAKAKKDIAIKKKGLYTYLNKKNMKAKFELIESPLKSQNNIGEEAYKNSSWLSKQSTTKTHEEAAAMSVARSLAHVSKAEITESNFDQFLQEVSTLSLKTKENIGSENSMVFFDHEKISNLSQQGLQKLQKNAYAVQGIAQNLEAKAALISAWYDYFRGGDLVSLIFKFCESFDSLVTLDEELVWSKSIADALVAKWAGKSVINTGRVTMLVAIAISQVSKAMQTRASAVVKNDLDSIKQVMEPHSSGRKKEHIDSSNPNIANIGAMFSSGDVDKIADRMYTFIEDIAKKGDNMSNAGSVAAADLAEKVKEKIEKSGGDKVTHFRNMGRLGIGICVGLEENNRIGGEVKSVIRRRILQVSS